MSDFTHLHVHSHYSLLDGLGKINALLDRAQAQGMTSLGLTDHGAMYGVVEFVKEAQARKMKPIIGVETYLAPLGHQQKRGRIDSDPRHLTLLASTEAGYKNLVKLVSTAYLEGFYYKPRIDYDLLKKHAEGVIVLSGCMNGDIPQLILASKVDEVKKRIEWHLNIFGRDRFYFEVQDHPSLRQQQIINEALISFSHQYGVGLVATADSHYIHPEDAEAQDVLICVQTGKTVQDKDRLCMLGEDFSLKGPAELKKIWKDHPEAIDNTQRIAELCNVNLQFGVNQLPHFPLPPGQTADQALRQLSEKGLTARYHQAPPDEAASRLNYELEVIKKTGFASYFLIVADFVNEAKRRGILVGPGRGSAAGSLVSYLTNITNIDPLKYSLLFERFLNPDRVNMPDIDLDFADDRRDEVIEYVRQKYGREHVAQIITFGTMAARAAVRDAGRALGLPYGFCDRLAKAIPPMTDFKNALSESTELRQMYDSDPQAKKLIDTARKLEGVCRHASTHAAGVVITEKPLTEYVPLQLAHSAKDDSKDTVTQFAMRDIEALGLLKIDFLGLKNLTIIQNTRQRILKRHQHQLDLDALPLDDNATYRLLQAGQTTGVFQLESSGMKRYLKELKPTEFEDIISILALYRPGPMDSIPDFIAGKHNKRKITYLHPSLKPILEKTYGVIVTQDQVLQIARDFAGFTYAQADILRKAVGKKIKELLDEQREKFINGAIETQKIDKKIAHSVWDFIEPFARYGFNRAHAACYAMIAYQTAYLKAHYPADFLAALLTSDLGDIERAAIEISEAVSLNIHVLPPSINESDHDFTVVTDKHASDKHANDKHGSDKHANDKHGSDKHANDKDALRFGLGGIKNVGDNVVTAMIAERTAHGPFTDAIDIFRRLDNKTINRKSAESLIKAGAFDALAERNFLLHNLERLLEFNRALHRQRDLGQQNLFGHQPQALSLPSPELEQAPAAPKTERLKWEKELLGLYVSEHPLNEYQPRLRGLVTPLLECVNLKPGGPPVRIAVIISSLRKITTKTQQPMVFAKVEDLTGSLELVVFPTVFSQTQELWQDGASLIVQGKINDKDGTIKLLCDKVWPLTEKKLQELQKAGSRLSSSQPTTRPQPTQPQIVQPPPTHLRLRLPPGSSRAQLERLHALLTTRHQDQGVPVELIVPDRGTWRRVTTRYRLPDDTETKTLLEQIVGQRAIQYT